MSLCLEDVCMSSLSHFDSKNQSGLTYLTICNQNQIIHKVYLLVAFGFEQQSKTTQQNEANNISESQQLSGYKQNTATAVASLQQNLRYGTTGLERGHAG